MASIYNLLENKDEEEAYRFARLSPDEQAALDRRQAEQTVSRGVESTARGMLGLPGANHRELAGMELKKLAETVRPGTEEFYAAAADIFRKHGLVAEAEQMEQRRHTLEVGKGEQNPALKMQRARDLLQKRVATDPSVVPAIAALDRQIAALGVKAEGAKASDPEFIRLLDAHEAAVAAGQTDRAEQIKRALDAWIKNKEKTGAEMSEYQKVMSTLAAKREVREQGKDVRKQEQEKESAARSLQGFVKALDADIQHADYLLAAPGLVDIVGPRAGALPLSAVVATYGADAGNAAAVYETVQAKTFLGALQDLRAASKTSASGLGQLTEREGDKIQAAKASLNRQQDLENFKNMLRNFIRTAKASRTVAEREAAQHKVTLEPPPPPLSFPKATAATAAPGVRGTRERKATEAPAEAPKPKGKWTAKRVE